MKKEMMPGHQMFIEKMTIEVCTTPAGVEYLPLMFLL
jgi:hypothetical protein